MRRGDFQFTVPAGPGYELYIFPPKGYKASFENPTPARVFADDGGRLFVELVIGTAAAPKVPTTCAGSGPSSGSSGPPPLADTGADAGGLTVVGGVAVFTGLLLLVAGPSARPLSLRSRCHLPADATYR